MAEKRPNLDYPVYLFHQGNNANAYDFMGSHRVDKNTVVFRTWAPHAQAVSVVGEFNNWDERAHQMYKISDGIWEIEISDLINEYTLYKYAVKAANGRM
ncbi:MAG: 1,4-alpha-glucan branching enzyme, partial [Clostridia bacterium]|nr:1,4-alpha-glucan branching enzyme [Clostridia bacterium]